VKPVPIISINSTEEKPEDEANLAAYSGPCLFTSEENPEYIEVDKLFFIIKLRLRLFAK
jgi:hypothetical protein